MATRIYRAVISVPSKANYPSLRVTFSPLLNALATREFSEDARQKSGGFWGSFMGSGDSRSGAHSKILSSKDTLYEFQCKASSFTSSTFFLTNWLKILSFC